MTVKEPVDGEMRRQQGRSFGQILGDGIALNASGATIGGKFPSVRVEKKSVIEKDGLLFGQPREKQFAPATKACKIMVRNSANGDDRAGCQQVPPYSDRGAAAGVA